MKSRSIRITALLMALVLIVMSGCGMKIVRLEDAVPANAQTTPAPDADSGPDADDGDIGGETDADSGDADGGSDISDDSGSDPDGGLPDDGDISDGGEQTAQEEHGRVKFGAMVSDHADFDAVREHIKRVSSMIDRGEDEDEIIREYDLVCRELDDYYTAYCLMNIYCAIDISDTEKQNEFEKIGQEYHELAAAANLLDGKIAASEYRNALMDGWTEDEFETLKISEKLSDNEYIELSDRKMQISMEYWQALNDTTVEFMGRELTYDDIVGGQYNSMMYEMLLGMYYEKLNQTLGELYLELTAINKRIAEKAGYDNYVDFAYEYEYEREYTPEDVRQLWQYVKDYVSDELIYLFGNLTYDEFIGLSKASSERDQLEKREELLRKYAGDMSPGMLEALDYMIEYELSVLTDSSTAQSGAFTTYLISYKAPVIYVALEGGYDDILSFLHEFGHFYGYYTAGRMGVMYTDLDVEEIMSRANELLFTPYFDEYMDDATFSAMKKSQMFSALYSIVDGCVYDEFQSYMYDNDVQTTEEINEAFASISRSYGLDESFYTIPIEYAWMEVSHNFETPMYYISYTMSAIPALELFTVSLDDRERATEMYETVVHSDPENKFSQVLDEAGLSSPFSEENIKALIDKVREYIAEG